jgi:hypothetical protein
MSDSNPVLARIAKLLALSQNSGATEAEASLAAEHVQRLLQENGLTMAQVEQAGGDASDVGGKREKRTTDRRAMYEYQRNLMAALANNNFCLHQIIKVQNVKPLYSGGRGKTSRCHVLVGRFINVQATEQMYDYLDSTMRRLSTEAGIDNRSTRELTFFLEGATSRVIERLVQRRREAELASRKAAPTGNGTGRELVLTDVYGSEADLNNDALNGFPAGTTATRRAQGQAKEMERRAKEEALVAAGVEATEAFYQSYGYGVEEAKTYADSWRKRSNRRNSGGGRGRSQNWTHADSKHHEKVNSASYQAGRSAGDNIGLDSQVGSSKRKLLK